VRIVELPAGGPHPWAPLALEDGFAGVHSGGVARVFDVRGPTPRAVLELPDVVAVAAT